MDTFYIPKARNERTKEVVVYKDLAGRRFLRHELQEVDELADALALQYTERTRELWIGFVDSYTA